MYHQHPNHDKKPLREGRQAAIKLLMKRFKLTKEEATLRYNSYNKYIKSEWCQKTLKK